MGQEGEEEQRDEQDVEKEQETDQGGIPSTPAKKANLVMRWVANTIRRRSKCSSSTTPLKNSRLSLSLSGAIRRLRSETGGSRARLVTGAGEVATATPSRLRLGRSSSSLTEGDELITSLGAPTKKRLFGFGRRRSSVSSSWTKAL